MATCGLCSAMMLSRINQRLGSLMLNPVSRGLTDSAGVSARGRRANPNRKQKRESGQPRREKMLPDQDWTSVYPTAAAFKPGSVPLPIRMGYPVERGVPPPKEGNLELMKIPNFLHLTPAAINKHCDALKVFCTEWPSALNSDAKCEERFPIKVQSRDFVFAGPSLRNSDARVITLKVKLSSLKLDDHARKKLVKLVGERYCTQTDILTLTADRCPLKKQNKDYVLYLLTVLYHESWKMEPWEQEKTVEDMEEYVWEGSASQRNVLDTLQRMKEVAGSASAARDQLLASAQVQEYSASVSRLKNEGESEDSVLQYRKAVKRVLFL